MHHAPTRLAFTMGDPAGIGPEIVAKAVREMAPLVRSGAAEFIVLGSAAALAQAMLGGDSLGEAAAAALAAAHRTSGNAAAGGHDQRGPPVPAR